MVERDAAALLAVPDSVLGFETAARALAVPWYLDHSEVTLSAPLTAHHFVPGVEIRRTSRLPPEHLTETRGLRHTTLARTLIDLAVVTRERRLQEVIEGEISARRVRWGDLEATFCALAGRAWAERQPGRVDGMWVGAKSIVELDGRRFHIRNAAFENDRRRDQLAVLGGYETGREGWGGRAAC